jgi:hypothetical protein
MFETKLIKAPLNYNWLSVLHSVEFIQKVANLISRKEPESKCHNSTTVLAVLIGVGVLMSRAFICAGT